MNFLTRTAIYFWLYCELVFTSGTENYFFIGADSLRSKRFWAVLEQRITGRLMERLKEGGGGGEGRKDLFLASCWCCFTLQTHKNDVFNGKVIRWTVNLRQPLCGIRAASEPLKVLKVREQSYDELFLAYSRIFGAVHLLGFLNFQKKNLTGGH